MSERPVLVATGESAPPQELVARVRAALADGALVALPTETVYGIAARADSAGALEALRVMKGRPRELTFTWHVAERRAVEQFGVLRPLATRLAARYWPGPLTLVLRGVPRGLERVAHDGWTGLRLPAHATTVALLAACDFPVVMSSANVHGEAPLTRAADVEARFGAGLSLVVDGGTSRLGEASGVLAVGPGRFELLREGLLRLAELRRTAGLRIAFVCTGNTCRSPMAEVLARRLLEERLGGGKRIALADFGFDVHSMGVYAAPGAPAAMHAQEIVAERGLDLSAHGARTATPEALLACDRIYALTAAHLEAVRILLPPSRLAPLELLDPHGADIADPVGGPRAAYQRALGEIETAVRTRLDEWA